MDIARRYARELARLVNSPDSEFAAYATAKGIDQPNFSLCLTEKGMAVYEPNLDKAWLLPKKAAKAPFHYLAELNDLVAPEWAVEKVAQAAKAIQNDTP